MRFSLKRRLVQKIATVFAVGLLLPALLSELFGWPALHEGAQRFGAEAGLAILFLIVIPLMILNARN